MASARASDGPMSSSARVIQPVDIPPPEPPPCLRRRSYPHRKCHPCPRFKVSPMSPPVQTPPRHRLFDRSSTRMRCRFVRLELLARLAHRAVSAAAGPPPRINDIPSHQATLPVAESRARRSEEHTSELQSHVNLVCRLLLEKKKYRNT